MSAWTYRCSNGKAAPKIVPPRLRIPWWKGLGADSEEKHEPASGVDTESVDSLKALDPERPIREADMAQRLRQLQGFPLAVCLFRFGPCAAGAGGWRAGCSVRPTASSA